MAVNGDDQQQAQAQGEPQQGPVEFLHGLRFPCPERFDGSEDKFEDFAYGLRSYLSTANPAFYRIMKEIEDSHSLIAIDWNGLEPTQTALSAQ